MEEETKDTNIGNDSPDKGDQGIGNVPDPQVDNNVDNGPDQNIPPQQEEVKSPVQTPKPPVKPTNVIQSIEERLGGKNEAEAKSEVSNPQNTQPFDITKLSREQMQSLKAQLAATPDTQTRKKQNPKTRLRRIDGKIVIDFSDSYQKVVEDRVNRRDVELPYIDIKFYGEKKFSKSIRHDDFIKAEQVSCEIVKTSQKVNEVIEGETMSRETGRIVEMVRKEIQNWYTVVLPDGNEIEIEGKLSNA